MARAHYHVMSSIPGCMPDANDIYDTKRDAQAGLRYVRDQFRESIDYERECDPDSTARVWGSIKSGLIVHEYGTHGQYLCELFACCENCDADSDY